MSNPLASGFVTQFRKSAAYINAFRGKTFVIYLSGSSILSKLFIGISQDIALLDSLGIKLVLIHGSRPQINTLLADESKIIAGVRVTDDAALKAAMHAAGNIRIEFEAIFSRASDRILNASTQSKEESVGIRLSSGNFIKAKPYGIRDGVDYEHTGEIRSIDQAAISAELKQGHMVLLSPLGYSSTGEVFNLCAEEVAAEVAINLRADKLIYLFDKDIVIDENKNVIRQLALEQIEQHIQQQQALNTHTKNMLLTSVHCCSNHVERVHFLNSNTNGALLQELFTSDGIGCLISLNPYEGTRPATIQDIAGILELIEPLEANGILVPRPKEKLQLDIKHFTVTERDGIILACAALYQFHEHRTAELACLAVHPEHQHMGQGDSLLRYLELQLQQDKVETLFVLSTRASHWFLDRGFMSTDLENLPLQRKALYNYQRNSKVFIKTLT